MSLLSVTVKKARYVGIQAATQFNTYVTLKLQNVKSTTVTVKGPTPCWEQDFLFEINDINLGLLVEVWNKGVIWDRALGYHYLPLTSVAFNGESGGRWVEIEAQLIMRGGAVVGTTGSTGHSLLLDCRFEPPFDAEGTGGADLQRKLDLLNGTLDAERAEQARRQMQYIAHSGYSEDSDYTSDLNYPLGQHANSSASQFRTAAHQMHTPQGSLVVSRENSYEREEYHIHGDTDPLYYNSQPRSNRLETWSQLHAQASVESAISWRTAADWQSAEEQRRPSLERQNTLYGDDMGYDAYSTSTHIRDHTHLSQQPSYEEYFDTSSYPYQTSYLGDDSRQWDSGGHYMYEDGYGMTPTEYENLLNKRRSSVVQLPQVPPKQIGHMGSSRYSDYNEMTPYRPRPRRTTASLPATPLSTPKRGRALPVPPGSESGSLRGGRGRRLPQPPSLPPTSFYSQFQGLSSTPSTTLHTRTHVPQVSEPEKTVPDLSYRYERYGYQSEFNTDLTSQYQDSSFTYNTTSSIEDGTQPFFDETPHATPPAAVHKTTLSETETLFGYHTTSEDESKSLSSVIYKPQVAVTTQQELYQDQSSQYHSQYDDQQYLSDQPVEQYQTQNQYQEIAQYKEFDKYQEEQYDQRYEQQYQEEQKEQQYQQQQYEQLQQQQLQQQYEKQQQQQFEQKQQQQQQAKQPAQQLQTTVLTGAATLGSLMAGGAKKLGSFFGAAAAAVAPPAVHPAHATPATSVSMNQFTSSTDPVTPFSSAVTVSSSVPDVSSSSVPVSTVTTSAPVTLPRTPSLRRQESIQRPSVRRTRTLPDAPEDLSKSSFDESAYEDEYHKTEYDQSLDCDRTSLDAYREDDYTHDTILEEVPEERRLSEVPSPGLQKVSPTRTVSQVRKPSVDSYHSQTPSIIDRKTSQSSFHHEEKLMIPTTQDESSTERSKVTFQEDRTTYHEVPEESDGFHEVREPLDDHMEDYRDEVYHDQDETYQDVQDKFDNQEQFEETDEQYPEEDAVFRDSQDRTVEERVEYQPEQPKLTPKQRWHRAYNKIVMQLNVSTFSIPDGECRASTLFDVFYFFIMVFFNIPLYNLIWYLFYGKYIIVSNIFIRFCNMF